MFSAFFTSISVFVRQTMQKLIERILVLGLPSYRHFILQTSYAKFAHTRLCFVTISVEVSSTPCIAFMQMLRRKSNFLSLPCSKKLCCKVMVCSLKETTYERSTLKVHQCIKASECYYTDRNLLPPSSFPWFESFYDSKEERVMVLLVR